MATSLQQWFIHSLLLKNRRRVVCELAAVLCGFSKASRRKRWLRFTAAGISILDYFLKSVFRNQGLVMYNFHFSCQNFQNDVAFSRSKKTPLWKKKPEAWGGEKPLTLKFSNRNEVTCPTSFHSADFFKNIYSFFFCMTSNWQAGITSFSSQLLTLPKSHLSPKMKKTV